MKSGLQGAPSTSKNPAFSLSSNEAFLSWRLSESESKSELLNESSELLNESSFDQSESLDPTTVLNESSASNIFTHGFVGQFNPMRHSATDRSEITLLQNHRITREAQAWIERGYGLHRLGNYEEAIVCFDTALELSSQLADAWQGKGICLGEMNESDGAIGCFEQVILINPDNYRGWHNRGKALMRVGRQEEAIGCFKRVLHLKPENYKAWYNRGLCLDHLRHLEQALHSFDQALSLKPDCYYAWSGRGNTLTKMHRFEEAVFAFDRSIDLRSHNFPAWYGKATCYAAARQTLPAIGSLSQAMAYAPQNVRNMAKEDSAFTHMRHEAAFQALFVPVEPISVLH